ncbi:MAG: HAMP domain-containing sensor histidine kinase [Archangium sp.]|nr:HAMP domain-containing sensor histidine kinase [Archangium sp.]
MSAHALRGAARRVAVLVAALGLAGAGFSLAVGALRDTISARKHLMSELSAAMGPTRALDVVAQQLRAEQGTAKSAEVLLADAVKAARTPDQRASLQRALACVADGGCADAQALIAPAQASSVAELEGTWAQADAVEASSRTATWLGLGLVLAAVLLMLAGGRPAAPAPAATAPADDGEVERLLRERLEALYSARAQLGDGARFGAFGELAAALSHGLKTPLAGISAAVQLAQLKLGDGNAARAELDEVVRLTEGLTEQVQRFLRAAGQVGPSRQRVPVQHFLTLVQEAYGAEAARRGVSLTTHDEAPGLEVEVDGSLLDMALRNLVENALAAAHGPSASVKLSARLAAAPARVGLDGAAPAPGAFVALVVEDNGPGLPTAARRTEAGVTTRAAGSGLGLAIARRVAERHGGALALEDREEGGARISLVLPSGGRG